MGEDRGGVGEDRGGVGEDWKNSVSLSENNCEVVVPITCPKSFPWE